MTEIESLSAEPRARAGKGAARSVRREGRIPGVIYGGKQPPILISLEYNGLIRELNKGGFMQRVFDLAVNGGETVRAVARDLQLDPVKDLPVHVDFLRIVEGAEIEVDVPVTFKNESASPGLRRGGVLNVVRHELSLRVRPDAIPDTVEIDLTGLNINDAIHISQVQLPAGTRSAITDRDFTVATIAAPTVLTAEETQTPETEVIGVEEGGEETEEQREEPQAEE